MSKSIACCSALAFSVPVHGADSSLAWQRFRGPNGSGIAADAKPPAEIGPDRFSTKAGRRARNFTRQTL